MADQDQWQALPPFWAQKQVERSFVTNLGLGQGLKFPHEPLDLNIEGDANYNDVPPVGGSGPRSVFSHTGALRVSFRLVYSRYQLTHLNGQTDWGSGWDRAIEAMEFALDWFESARFPQDSGEGWEGSAGPLLLLSIPSVLDILCNLRRLRMVPDRDFRGRLRRVDISCTFQEVLEQRYTCADVFDVGMHRVEFE